MAYSLSTVSRKIMDAYGNNTMFIGRLDLLLFLAQGLHLGRYGEPLIDNKFKTFVVDINESIRVCGMDDLTSEACPNVAEFEACEDLNERALLTIRDVMHFTSEMDTMDVRNLVMNCLCVLNHNYKLVHDYEIDEHEMLEEFTSYVNQKGFMSSRDYELSVRHEGKPVSGMQINDYTIVVDGIRYVKATMEINEE